MIKALRPKRSKSFRDKYLALLMIAAAFFFHSCATAQYDSTKQLQRNNAYGYDFNNLRVRGLLLLPRDTVKMAMADSGAVAVVRNSLYTWTGYLWTSASGTASLTDIRNIVRDSNLVIRSEIASVGHDNWGTDYVNTTFGLLGKGTVAEQLYVDSTQLTTKYRHDSLLNVVIGLMGGITPTSVTNVGTGWPLVAHPSSSVYSVKRLAPGSSISFDTLTANTITINASITPGGVELNSDTLITSVSTNKTVGAMKILTFLLVKPVSDATAFRAGTLSSPQEYVSDMPLAGGVWNTIQVNAFMEGSTTVYFAGITSSTRIKIITTPLHE